MRRVSVIGSSGSGKSTVARSISDQLGLRYLELDAIFHQPGWVPKPDAQFRAEVAEFVRAKHWVVDGNYTTLAVAELVWPAADTIIWLDPPRRTVMRRVIVRTLRRVITREELWNGNREPWSNLYSFKPEKNIILWAWTRFARTRAKYEALSDDGTWAHVDVRRLRSPRDVAALLLSLED